jgi:hypothetical protein
MSHEDWLPTLVAAAGDPGIKEKLLKGMKIGDKTVKTHLDGYNFMPFFTGETDKGPAALAPLPSLRRTPTASTMWPATSGSGSATGIGQTTTPNSRQRAAWRTTRKALPHPLIQPSHTRRSACSAGTNHFGSRLVSTAR